MFPTIYRLTDMVLILPVATTIVERAFLDDEDYQGWVAQHDVHNDFLMT